MEYQRRLQTRHLACWAVWCLLLAGSAWGQSESPSRFTARGNRAAQSAAPGQFLDRIYHDEHGDHKYVLFVPAGYSPAQKWPTILYLHGAHCRGKDGRAPLVSGLAPAIKTKIQNYPFLVVFPQCENTHSVLLQGWSDEYDDAARALKILDAVERDYSVDTSREILMGSSMGGTGVWEMGARTPERWSALVPSAAYGNPALAAQVARIPIWSFHVTNDQLTPVTVARDMVTAVRAAGGRAYLSEVEGRRHADCNMSFLQPALHEWLLDPQQEPQVDHLHWTWPEGFNEGFEDEVPYVPGAEISGAIQMRVCKDLLESLSYALPQSLADQPMAGYSPNVRQSTQVGFLPFNIAMSGIQYQGQVERAQLIPMDSDRMQVQLGLRNVTMSIAQSQIKSGRLFSASAGRMSIVIGHRAPVWLSVTVRPRVENRRIRLELVGVHFQIPSDNWYVTDPVGVSVRGMPFLNQHVSDGLVDGVYSRKGDIEQQVRSSVRGMLPEIEATLNQQFETTLKVNELAIPVWHPRVKIWPEQLHIDARGLSMVLGATIARMGDPPADFRVRNYPTKLTDRLAALESGVEVAISEQFVPAYTELLIAGKVNDLHAVDFRLKEFDALNEREFLRKIIPDFQQFGDDVEANVTFEMREPVQFKDIDRPLDCPAENHSSPAAGVEIVFPQLRTVISTRRVGERAWKPYVEVDQRASREYGMSVVRGGYSSRATRLTEASELRLVTTAKFAEGYIPHNPEIHLAPLISQLDKALIASCGAGPSYSIQAKDVDVIGVPLRLEMVDQSEGLLFVQQQVPGIVISNPTSSPMTYRVRVPYMHWSPPRILAPGERFEHSSASPLFWHCQHSGKSLMSTMPLGREATFRDQPSPELILQTGEILQADDAPEGLMLKFLGY